MLPEFDTVTVRQVLLVNALVAIEQLVRLERADGGEQLLQEAERSVSDASILFKVSSAVLGLTKTGLGILN